MSLSNTMKIRIFAFVALLVMTVSTAGFCAGADSAKPQEEIPALTAGSPVTPQEAADQPQDIAKPAVPAVVKPGTDARVGVLVLAHGTKKWEYGYHVPFKLVTEKLAPLAKVMAYDEFREYYKKVPVKEALKPETVAGIGRKASLDYVIVVISEPADIIDNKTVWDYHDRVKVYRASDGALVYEKIAPYRWLVKDVQKSKAKYLQYIDNAANAYLEAIKPFFAEGG